MYLRLVSITLGYIHQLTLMVGEQVNQDLTLNNVRFSRWRTGAANAKNRYDIEVQIKA